MLMVAHHLPYQPWSNVIIEGLGKELIPTFRTLLSGMQWRSEDWIDLITTIQTS